MIRLEDYLYDEDTIFRIISKYAKDLEDNAILNHNKIDLAHSNFLKQIYELLEHNEFLTSQSQRLREFYNYMVREYPYLAFNFKGRIKSLIRAEGKFNRYVVDYTYDYYREKGSFPSADQVKSQLQCFRDLIAYRIVISLPKCREADKQKRSEEEIRLLYEIANALPEFLQQHDFALVESNMDKGLCDERIEKRWRKYYRDYVAYPTALQYQSLHLTVFDNLARGYIEIQLRTKDMDDNAEIGLSNHECYEKEQASRENCRREVPIGYCQFFDQAYERMCSLEELDLSKLDVNMFAATNNSLINDGCGLYRGRQILPFEHLSRFQNEVIN